MTIYNHNRKETTMKPLSMPDLTPAQLVAIVGSLLAVGVAAGLDISQSLQDSIITLVTVLSGVLVVGDGVIRHGRSRALLNPPKGEVSSDNESPSA